MSPALPYTAEDDAVLVDSGEWTGEECVEAQEKMAAFAQANGFGTATVTYRLKDWGVSRQRYWGTPIPMVYCANGHAGVEPGGVVALPESALPVVLPAQVEITQQGGSPLGRVPEFREYDLPGVRRAGAARDGHDGYVRRFELVLLPVYGCEEFERRRFDSDEGELLVSDRPVHRRRGARDSAPDLLALLDEGDARPWIDQER